MCNLVSFEWGGSSVSYPQRADAHLEFAVVYLLKWHNAAATFYFKAVWDRSKICTVKQMEKFGGAEVHLKDFRHLGRESALIMLVPFGPGSVEVNGSTLAGIQQNRPVLSANFTKKSNSSVLKR